MIGRLTHWSCVVTTFFSYVISARHEGAKDLSENFFFDNVIPFFDSSSTTEPTFDDAAEHFFDVEEEHFFKKENDIFEKMKDDEAFFFKDEKESGRHINDNHQTQIVSQSSRFCNCHDVYCGCCSSVKLFGKEKFKGCFEMEYIRNDFAIFVTLSINGHIIITRVLSGRNPLPFCARTPYVPLMSFCIRLYDIHHNTNGLSLCVRLEVCSMRQILFSISFDCIKIVDHKITFVMPPNATTFGLVGLHLGNTDPYISYQDWTKLHFPLPEITLPPTTTVKPKTKHHFLWF